MVLFLRIHNVALKHSVNTCYVAYSTFPLPGILNIPSRKFEFVILALFPSIHGVLDRGSGNASGLDIS